MGDRNKGTKSSRGHFTSEQKQKVLDHTHNAYDQHQENHRGGLCKILRDGAWSGEAEVTRCRDEISIIGCIQGANRFAG